MKLFFIFCLILFSHNLNAQSESVVWAHGFGNQLDDYCTSVATDAHGNVYATGFINGTVDFDPGPGVFYLTDGMFITKMDAAGNLIWAKQIGNWLTSATYITLDSSGNIYITGAFGSTVDFDPGPNVYNLTTIGSVRNPFVSKYDSAGNFIWAKSFDGAPSSSGGTGMRLAIDSKGNVYTGGRFTVSFDFDPGPGAHNLTSVGGQDIFIDKLDSSGNFIWARSFGQPYDDELQGISIDASDNVYTAGYFGSTADNHAYFNKFDSSGNPVWSKKINCTGASVISSMVADKNRIYMLGLYRDTAYFSTGSGTIDLISSGGYNSFVCRSDTAGNFIWAKSFGSDLNSMAKDFYGNIYTAGDSTSYDSGTYNITAYVNKLDTSGNFLWAKYMGGDSLNEALSIAVDNTGDIYLGGIFQGTANFDGIILHAVPAPADYPLPGESMPTSDLFILKLIQIANPNVWKGSISNSWSVAGNWDKNVIPDINSNVVIPSGVLIYPIVDTTSEIKSLFLQNGASLKVESNVKLKIDGH